MHENFTLMESLAEIRNAITLGRADAIASGTIQHYHFQARKPA